jgi:hypothetical protein
VVEKKKLFFKFIVDDVWNYSSEYAQLPDSEGNWNNTIDLTDPERSIMPMLNPIEQEREMDNTSSDSGSESYDDDNPLNDFDELWSEINNDIDPPKLPDLLETSKFFNKDSAQKDYFRKVRERNSSKDQKEFEFLNLLYSLDIKLNVPFYPQL